MKCGCITKNKF